MTRVQVFGCVLVLGALWVGVPLGIYGRLTPEAGWNWPLLVLVAASILAGGACAVVPAWRQS
jgi:hypothetical protein